MEVLDILLGNVLNINFTVDMYTGCMYIFYLDFTVILCFAVNVMAMLKSHGCWLAVILQ